MGTVVAEFQRWTVRQEGIEQGLEQGREQGIERGQVAVLVQLVARKFGRPRRKCGG